MCSMEGILLDGFVKSLNKLTKILNLYGPYSDRRYFWEQLKLEGFLNYPYLLVGGDLNLVTSSREVCRKSSHLDVLGPFFKSLLEEVGLVDVESLPLRLMWQNDRSGSTGVTK